VNNKSAAAVPGMTGAAAVCVFFGEEAGDL
jgi:hypothetical protein